jgi:hypothetical protein
MLADDPPFGADTFHVRRVTQTIGFFASVATATVIPVAVRGAMSRIIRCEPSHQVDPMATREHADVGRPPPVAFRKWC